VLVVFFCMLNRDTASRLDFIYHYKSTHFRTATDFWSFEPDSSNKPHIIIFTLPISRDLKFPCFQIRDMEHYGGHLPLVDVLGHRENRSVPGRPDQHPDRRHLPLHDLHLTEGERKARRDRPSRRSVRPVQGPDRPMGRDLGQNLLAGRADRRQHRLLDPHVEFLLQLGPVLLR
jgi:hypothetical protein